LRHRICGSREPAIRQWREGVAHYLFGNQFPVGVNALLLRVCDCLQFRIAQVANHYGATRSPFQTLIFVGGEDDDPLAAVGGNRDRLSSPTVNYSQ
jgi:hypothetical protein